MRIGKNIRKTKGSSSYSSEILVRSTKVKNETKTKNVPSRVDCESRRTEVSSVGLDNNIQDFADILVSLSNNLQKVDNISKEYISKQQHLIDSTPRKSSLFKKIFRRHKSKKQLQLMISEETRDYDNYATSKYNNIDEMLIVDGSKRTKDTIDKSETTKDPTELWNRHENEHMAPQFQSYNPLGKGVLVLVSPEDSPSIVTCVKDKYNLESTSSIKLEEDLKEKFLQWIVKHWIYEAVFAASNIIETTGNLLDAKKAANDIIYEKIIDDENTLNLKKNKKVASKTSATIIAGLHSGIGTVQQAAQIFTMLEAEGLIIPFSSPGTPDKRNLNVFSLSYDEETFTKTVSFTKSGLSSYNNFFNFTNEIETSRCAAFDFVIQLFEYIYPCKSECEKEKSNYDKECAFESGNDTSESKTQSGVLPNFVNDFYQDLLHLDSPISGDTTRQEFDSFSATVDKSRNESSFSGTIGKPRNGSSATTTLGESRNDDNASRDMESGDEKDSNFVCRV